MISPSVREFKTVLVTGIHTIDSRYQALDSMQFLSVELGFWFPIVRQMRIPDSKARDSEFLERNIFTFFPDSGFYT